MTDYKEEFEEKGYCRVPLAISNELRDFVTQYALFDEMQDFTPDGNQVPAAHAKYADPAMESMLLHLQKIIENATGLALFPTYSFYRVYRPGDELVKHRDRYSCEISCTLCFNHSYDRSEYTWPIFMDGKSVDLEPGDLVIYRGIDLEHWREKFSISDPNAWHVQGFFHYVNANGQHANCKFDGRESIGEDKLAKQSKHNLSNKSYIEYVN